MSQSVLVCVEDNLEFYKQTLCWTLKHLIHSGDEVHVITLLPISSYSSAMPTSGPSNKKRGENQGKAAVDLQREVVDEIKRLDLKLGGIKTHALVAGGMLEGNAVVEYADSRNIDLVILGRKDCDNWSSLTFQSFLGCVFPQCSVSSYCLQHMHCPVMLVTPDAVTHAKSGTTFTDGAARISIFDDPLKGSRDICVVCELQESSVDMVPWAIGHLLRPGDRITVISVSSMLKPITPQEAAGPTTMSSWSFDAMEILCKSVANQISEGMEDMFTTKIQQGSSLSVTHKTLIARQPGLSGIADTVVEYVDINGCDFIVVNGEHPSGCSRMLDGLLGSGSVAEACSQAANCPVLIYKQ